MCHQEGAEVHHQEVSVGVHHQEEVLLQEEVEVHHQEEEVLPHVEEVHHQEGEEEKEVIHPDMAVLVHVHIPLNEEESQIGCLLVTYQEAKMLLVKEIL